MTTLLPIPQFIETARRQGAVFGGGDAKIHLAYLTKIGILPQALKRKIDAEIVGCYPAEAIQTLLKAEQMKNSGMTYSQIAKLLQRTATAPALSPVLDQPPVADIMSVNNVSPKQFNNLSFISSPSFLYLVIGLLFGLLLSSFNSQGLAQLQKQTNLTFAQPPVLSDYERQSNQILNTTSGASQQEQQPIYVIAVPKQNLDKLQKTNINYLINN